MADELRAGIVGTDRRPLHVTRDHVCYAVRERIDLAPSPHDKTQSTFGLDDAQHLDERSRHVRKEHHTVAGEEELERPFTGRERFCIAK